jgi:HlyD family secretion protein
MMGKKKTERRKRLYLALAVTLLLALSAIYYFGWGRGGDAPQGFAGNVPPGIGGGPAQIIGSGGGLISGPSPGMASRVFAGNPDKLSYEAMDVPQSNFTAVARGKVDVEGGVIEVAARGGGIFSQVMVSEGDHVEAGQVLAVQEDDQERISLRTSKAALESSRASLESTELRLEIARRELNRLRPLREIDAVSHQELDQAEDRARQAEIDLRSQRAALLQAEASLEAAEFRLEQRTVRAPLSGRIIEAKARPGVGASTTEVSTAFKLMPDAQRIVRADLDESSIGAVEEGQIVLISPDADPMRIYQGVVLHVSEMVTSGAQGGMGAGGSVIEVIIGAGDLPLLIGQRVLVRFLRPQGNVAPGNAQFPTPPNGMVPSGIISAPGNPQRESADGKKN